MLTPEPSAEHPGGTPVQPEPPEQRPSVAADDSGASAPGDERHTKHSNNSKHHPTVLAEQAQRTKDVQLRIADWITTFAGSMNFVYLHIALFTLWMLFIESTPWPTLTLIVSLEAIFLSTFVMIGQNRQAAFQQAKADHDFTEQELELKSNTQLTREIHTLTTELHNRLLPRPSRQQS
ncbi:MAG: hypothetical protein QOE97_2435 [Pseudonocardiales bacterium]|jgi:uncharacterized membrane protein|nr:hypothetical protein [Pseudonocardiales bacterium]